jgi:hypothetical protein
LAVARYVDRVGQIRVSQPAEGQLFIIGVVLDQQNRWRVGDHRLPSRSVGCQVGATSSPVAASAGRCAPDVSAK